MWEGYTTATRAEASLDSRGRSLFILLALRALGAWGSLGTAAHAPVGGRLRRWLLGVASGLACGREAA
eukprot:scaffold37243_cov19-Phaeocystis_antarctica.AAC.3